MSTRTTPDHTTRWPSAVTPGSTVRPAWRGCEGVRVCEALEAVARTRSRARARQVGACDQAAVDAVFFNALARLLSASSSVLRDVAMFIRMWFAPPRPYDAP